MRRYNRIFVVVIDSLGVGAMPDAERFGDAGSNTLKHISESVESFRIPNLQRLGIANLAKWGHRRDPQGYAQELERFD